MSQEKKEEGINCVLNLSTKTTKLIWTITLILAFLGGVGIYVVDDQYQHYCFLQEKIQLQSRRLQDLKSWYSQHKKLLRKVAVWNQFWQKLKKTNLDPEKWSIHSFSIKTRLEEQELQKLLKMLSTHQYQPENIWFNPKGFKVIPSKTRIGGNKNQTSKQRYQFYVKLDGEFLKAP